MAENRWTKILTEIKRKIQQHKALLDSLSLSSNFQSKTTEILSRNKELLGTAPNSIELVYLLEADDLDDVKKQVNLLNEDIEEKEEKEKGEEKEEEKQRGKKKRKEEEKTENEEEEEEEEEEDIERFWTVKPNDEAREFVKTTSLEEGISNFYDPSLYTHIISLAKGLEKLRKTRPEFTQKQEESRQSEEFEIDLLLTEKDKIIPRIREVIDTIGNFYNDLNKINTGTNEIVNDIATVIQKLSEIKRKIKLSKIKEKNKQEILSFIDKIKEEYEKCLNKLALKTEENELSSFAPQATESIREVIHKVLEVENGKFPQEESKLEKFAHDKSSELAHLLKLVDRLEPTVRFLLREIDEIKSEISNNVNMFTEINKELSGQITEEVMKEIEKKYLQRIQVKKEIINKIKKQRAEKSLGALPEEESEETMKQIENEFDAIALSYLRSGILKRLGKEGAAHVREFTRVVAHANYLYLTILQPYISLIASVTVNYMLKEGIFKGTIVPGTVIGDCRDFYENINQIIPLNKIIDASEFCSSDKGKKNSIINFIKEKIAPNIIKAMDLTPDKLDEVFSVLEYYAGAESKRGGKSINKIIEAFERKFISEFITNFYEIITNRTFSAYLNDAVASDLRRWRTISATRISNRKNIHIISRIIAFEAMIKNAKQVLEFYTESSLKKDDEKALKKLKDDFMEIIKEIGLSIQRVFTKEVTKKKGKDKITEVKVGVNLSPILASSLMAAIEVVKPSFKYKTLLGMGKADFSKEEDTTYLAELLGMESNETEADSETSDIGEENFTTKLINAAEAAAEKLFMKDVSLTIDDEETQQFLTRLLKEPEGKVVDLPIAAFKTIIKKVMSSLYSPSALKNTLSEIGETLIKLQEGLNELPEPVKRNMYQVYIELERMINSPANAYQVIKLYFGFHLAIFYYIEQIIVKRAQNVNRLISKIAELSEVLVGYSRIKDVQERLGIVQQANLKELLKIADIYLTPEEKEEILQKTGINISEAARGETKAKETTRQLLYNLIAQIKNDLNRKMAELGGKDSYNSKTHLAVLIKKLNAIMGSENKLASSIQTLLEQYRKKFEKESEKAEQKQQEVEQKLEVIVEGVLEKLAAAAYHTTSLVNDLADIAALVIWYTTLTRKLEQKTIENPQSAKEALNDAISDIMKIVTSKITNKGNPDSLKEELLKKLQDKCQKVTELVEKIKKEGTEENKTNRSLEIIKALEDKGWLKCSDENITNKLNEITKHLEKAIELLEEVYRAYKQLGINVDFDQSLYSTVVVRALNSLFAYPILIAGISKENFEKTIPKLSEFTSEQLLHLTTKNIAGSLVQETQFWFKVFNVAFTLPVKPLDGERLARIWVGET